MKSIMFDSIPKALEHANNSGRSDFMLMRLLESNNHSYRWEVLPHGSWNGYNYGMKIFKNPVVMIGIAGLAIFGAYKLFKNGL